MGNKLIHPIQTSTIIIYLNEPTEAAVKCSNF